MKLTTSLIIALLIAIGLIGFYRKRALKFKEERAHAYKALDLSQRMASEEGRKAEYYRTKNGLLVSKSEALEIDNKALAKSNQEWINKFGKLKKDYRNLEFAFNAKIDVSDTVTGTATDSVFVYVTDSTGYQLKEYTFTDEWATITAKEIGDNKALFTYRVTVSVSGILYWDRKWFLGRKRYWGVASSDNPNASIPELVMLKTGGKRKRSRS